MSTSVLSTEATESPLVEPSETRAVASVRVSALEAMDRSRLLNASMDALLV